MARHGTNSVSRWRLPLVPGTLELGELNRMECDVVLSLLTALHERPIYLN